MSVWAPNSESRSRACGKLAEKLISWIIFDRNRVRRKIGKWGLEARCDESDAIVNRKPSKFSDSREKNKNTYQRRAV